MTERARIKKETTHTQTDKMSGSSNSQNTTIAIAAAAAAVAGAAAGVLASQYYLQRQSNKAVVRDTIPPTVFMNEPQEIKRQGSFLFPHDHEERMRRQIAARHSVEEENSVPRNSVTVRVPATSANMGPGCTYFEMNLRLFLDLNQRSHACFPLFSNFVAF